MLATTIQTINMKEIITAAGELGSVGVIIVPAFNSQVPVMPHTMETRNFLCEQFNEMGTFAAEHVWYVQETGSREYRNLYW